MVRLAIARLWFCSNSFNPRRTGLADLQRHEWTEGPAALLHPRAPRSDIDGLAVFLAARPHWNAVMLRCAAAPSGGPLAAEVLGTWMAELEQALQTGRFDALYVSLHGACQAEGEPGADLTVLRNLRRVARRLPIVASFDSRANISDEMPLLLDGASAARGPGDGAAAAGRALVMLEGILDGRIRPVGAVVRLPAIMPHAQLRRVMEQVWRDDLGALCAPGAPAFDARVPGARVPDSRVPGAWVPGARELDVPVLDASVFSGFAWADTAWAGPSALAWADRDAGAARAAASWLARRLERGREPGTGQNLQTAANTLASVAMRGSTLVLDPADDPDLGGLGDTPELLRALLATVSATSALGVLADPGAVAAAHAAGEGAAFDHPLGACLTSVYGPPVVARVRVGRLLPGMAVLQAGPVAILVAERPTAPEPALLEAAGIDLGGLRVLALKGGEAARAAFAHAFPVAVMALCPGPSSPDLASLPYANVPAGRRGRAPQPARPRGVVPWNQARGQWTRGPRSMELLSGRGR